jgi:recombinational DNA repair protein (RecF pathway)
MKALIYQIVPYHETSTLLKVVTQTGRKTLYAVGSLNYKHPNHLVAQLYNEIDYQDRPSKEFQKIYHAVILNTFEEVKTDLTKNFYLGIISQLIEFSSFDAPNDFFYQVLKELLTSESFENQFLWLLMHLLHLEGVDLLFSPDSLRSGLLLGDPNHPPQVHLDPLHTNLLHQIQQRQPVNLDASQFTALFHFLEQYYAYHLDWAFHTRKGKMSL